MSMRAFIIVAAALASLSTPSAGQVPGWDGTGLHVTRAELEATLARQEAVGARNEAAAIRQRLDEGDLRVGDRVLLYVEGQPQLSDTFNVVAGRKLILPDIGEVALAGVLRAELQDHLTAEVGRYLRSPLLRARSLIRLEVMGAVGRPGFYAVPADVLISDALMIAGGPAGNARMERIKIQRGRDVLWDGDRLRAAVVEGRTLDQLGVRAGDAILVPERKPSLATFRDVLMIASGIASFIWVLDRAGAF
jgi:protein involved in polysaccharide export with SLBB domain